MGSLMAGWNSPVLMDPDTAKLERNRSLTKEEIETFRKLRCKYVDEDGTDELLSPSFANKDSPKWGSGDVDEKSNFTGHSLPNTPVENKFGDWWMKSKWAFLNEPPLDVEESEHKYIPQYDVANLATK